jgi:hypothetical protein
MALIVHLVVYTGFSAKIDGNLIRILIEKIGCVISYVKVFY